jgi:hypothetical protein
LPGIIYFLCDYIFNISKDKNILNKRNKKNNSRFLND